MKEEDYKKIIEDMPIGYARHRVILDNQGRPLDFEYIEVNRSFELQTGLNRDAILGKRATEILPGIDKDGFDWIDFYGEVAQSGQPREVEQYSEPLKKWYRVKVNSPRKGEFITYVTDITDEKNEVQEKLNFLMASNDIVFEVDEDYNYMDIIVEDEEKLFVPKKEILGKNIGYIFEDEFKAEVLKALDTAKISGKKETLVYSSILEGDDRWFYSEIKYIDSASDPKFIVGVHDITEEKN